MTDEPEHTQNEDAELSSLSFVLAQLLLGALCYVFFVVPYVRRIRGLSQLSRDRRIYLANHVSLLDTILLGGIFWSRGRLPILVLGDREVWHQSWIHRALSARVGYLIERKREGRNLIRQLRNYGRAAGRFNLIIFPEGTRGDGENVGACQPGIYSIAQSARVPIVPIFIAGMQRVSSKTNRYRPFRGLRQIEVRFGQELAVADYSALDREAFSERVRTELETLAPQR